MDEQWRSHERQYTLTESIFIKSELPEDALPTSRVTGRKVYPQWSRERLENEAATLKFIASTTSIPVPKFLDLYEENGLLHLKTERAIGCTLEHLASDTATRHVNKCMEQFILPELRKLQHHTTGSVDARLPLIPPSRITYRDKRPSWSRKTSRNEDFVFCHNDLGQHNIFVDPETFNITAIIDWEFAGYYTTEFEYPLWLKPYNEQGNDHLQTDNLIKFLDSTGE
ncbi:aminoglycoside phosphotransferase [Amniculicola lignicola CBS 123094]|uniref:Aminoglycoside phosphotransferase n=1 Tax=Amniculicola lignicola CBS 123094 TaxID=1392246 RepID=A0A6A5VWH0_9PLEO|nr:aminoglycoside phosphotransferase [Amniculicola lignicola CBS 123094]